MNEAVKLITGQKVINKKTKKVGKSGAKWIIFTYFYPFNLKKREWPHLSVITRAKWM